jgi:hypothetical protein
VFENKAYERDCDDIMGCLLSGDSLRLMQTKHRLLAHTRKTQAEVNEFLSAFEDNIFFAIKPFFHMARDLLQEEVTVSIIYNILMCELVAFLNNYEENDCVCIHARCCENFVLYNVSKWVFRLAQADNAHTRNTVVTRFQVKTKRKRVPVNDRQIQFVCNAVEKLKQLQHMSQPYNDNPWICKLVHVFVAQAQQRVVDGIEDLACATVLRRVCKRSRDAYRIEDTVHDVTTMLSHVVAMMAADACPDNKSPCKTDMQCTRCRFEATCFCEACEHSFCDWHFGQSADERCELCVKEGAAVCDPCAGMSCAPGTP